MTFYYRCLISATILAPTLFSAVKAGLAPSACDMENLSGTSGGTVRFFDYGAGDTTSLHDIDFLSGGYLNNTYVDTITGVQDLEWDSGWPATNPPYGFTGVPIENFLMEITGYYYAPQTGIYTVSTHVDDSITIFMGAGDAFDCCGQHNDFEASNFIFTNVYGAGVNSREVYLEAGYYYPFKVVYINYMERAFLKVTMNLPDGTHDPTIGNNLYAFPDVDPSECAVISKTHSFTTSTVTGYTTTTKYVPTATGTKTISTMTTTSYINDDDISVDVIYVVEVPIPATTTSRTTTLTITTGTNPLITETQVSTITTGSINTVETIYVVKTLHTVKTQITTTTVPASIPTITTTTVTSFFTGTDGFETPDIIVVIKTPRPIPSTVTSYTAGTVTKPTTIATLTTIFTGTDGELTTDNVLVIETPEPSTITSFTPGSVTEITTVLTTTDICTGSDGEAITKTIVIVETPYSTHNTMKTSSVESSSSIADIEISISLVSSSISTSSEKTDTSLFSTTEPSQSAYTTSPIQGSDSYATSHAIKSSLLIHWNSTASYLSTADSASLSSTILDTTQSISTLKSIQSPGIPLSSTIVLSSSGVNNLPTISSSGVNLSDDLQSTTTVYMIPSESKQNTLMSTPTVTIKKSSSSIHLTTPTPLVSTLTKFTTTNRFSKENTDTEILSSKPVTTITIFDNGKDSGDRESTYKDLENSTHKNLVVSSKTHINIISASNYNTQNTKGIDDNNGNTNGDGAIDTKNEHLSTTMPGVDAIDDNKNVHSSKGNDINVSTSTSSLKTPLIQPMETPLTETSTAIVSQYEGLANTFNSQMTIFGTLLFILFLEVI